MPFFFVKPCHIGSSHSRHKSRRGQVLIEAAFVMPLLLLAMLCIVQFGLVFNARLAVEHACREGARYAAIHARDLPTKGTPSLTADDVIEAQTISIARKMGLSLSTADVSVGSLPCNIRSPLVTSNRPLYGTITITITYDMNKRRIMPRNFYTPLSKATVVLPAFAAPYIVSQSVVMEGSDPT